MVMKYLVIMQEEDEPQSNHAWYFCCNAALCVGARNLIIKRLAKDFITTKIINNFPSFSYNSV